MSSNSKQLPDWFDWKDYEQLSHRLDNSKWAYLFAVRDKDAGIDLKEIGYSQSVDGDWLERIPRLFWRKGVLFHGMKGHRNHEYLERRNEWFARDAEFILEDEYQRRQKSGEFKTGMVITTVSKDGINGHYIFTDKESFEEYDKTRRVLSERTIELAINIAMPKKDILEEIAIIIDTQQSRFGGEFIPKKLKRQTVLQWSRGLASWDLKQEGFSQYQIAKFLAPLWRENDMPTRGNEPAQDEDKKQVKTALQAVEQMINGGWKVLCGDPVATLDTDLLKLVYGHRE
jgi:hypothetical protein